MMLIILSFSKPFQSIRPPPPRRKWELRTARCGRSLTATHRLGRNDPDGIPVRMRQQCRSIPYLCVFRNISFDFPQQERSEAIVSYVWRAMCRSVNDIILNYKYDTTVAQQDFTTPFLLSINEIMLILLRRRGTTICGWGFPVSY